MLFLVLLSLLLLWFISKITLECAPREHQTDGALRVGDRDTHRGDVISGMVTM